MKFYLFLTICLMGSTLAQGYHSGGIGGGGHHNGGWGGGMVVSKKDAGSGVSAIYQQVKETLDKATQGITAAELRSDAESIQISADAYVDSNGGVVSEKDIMAVIDEVAATFNGAVAISALFDTPLIFEGSLLDSALCLWEGLVNKSKQLEAAGESPIAAIAAISLTARSIQIIALETVTIVEHKHLEKQEGIDVPPEETPGGALRKRWDFKEQEEPAKRIYENEWDRDRFGLPGGGRRDISSAGSSDQESPDKRTKIKDYVGNWDRPERPGGRAWRRDGSSAASSEQANPAKRVYIEDYAGSWDRPGRPGGGGWRRSMSSPEKRGNWTGSVSGGYSTSGGASVGGKVSYSWNGRR